MALADAWQKGAAAWPWAKRVALANDPLDLQATATGVNRSKGAGDAATWLPPLRERPVRLRRAPGGGQGQVRARGHRARSGTPSPGCSRPAPGSGAPTSDAPTLAPLRSPGPAS